MRPTKTCPRTLDKFVRSSQQNDKWRSDQEDSAALSEHDGELREAGRALAAAKQAKYRPRRLMDINRKYIGPPNEATLQAILLASRVFYYIFFFS